MLPARVYSLVIATALLIATAAEAQRDRAINEWRKRIPPGAVPQRGGAQGRLPVPSGARGLRGR